MLLECIEEFRHNGQWLLPGLVELDPIVGEYLLSNFPAHFVLPVPAVAEPPSSGSSSSSDTGSAAGDAPSATEGKEFARADRMMRPGRARRK